MTTIFGSVPSKSNCYKIVTIGNHASLAKSKALKEWEQKFYLQCDLRDKQISGFFRLRIDVYFDSNRKDLDNSLKATLDCLQACRAITNDRNCTEILARKFVDKERPRIEFEVTEI